MNQRHELHFAEDFQGARRRFHAACDLAGVRSDSIIHPLKGPDGGELAVDVVFFGNRSAERLLVLTSGVHGPELMTGSGCQVGMIADGVLSDIPDGVGVLVVHAANPWGSAHLRRNNEDNVDLCRNFVDFDDPPPRNEDYDRIKDFLPIAFAQGKEGDAARAAIDRYKREHGEDAFGRGFMAGQYHDPKGVSFGGTEAVWSRRIMEECWSTYGARAGKLCFIDFHSGLGPYAYGTTVSLQAGEAMRRAQRIFGKWVLAVRADDHKSDGKAPDVSGHTTQGHERAFAGAEVTSVVLEFGVEPYDHTAEILMREHRLHFDSSTPADQRRRCKQDLLKSFYPQDPYWRRAVFNHSLQATEQALSFLSEG